MNTFCKIGPNEWGVALTEGVALEPGAAVEITLRNGGTKTVTLGEFVGMRFGKNIHRTVHEAKKVENEATAPVPVTDERIAITGEVLTVKHVDTRFGPATKMLVKDDRGFKVYGTKPAALGDVERGARVTFVAGVKPSDNDPTFGFINRPAGAMVLAPAAATEKEAA